MPIQSKAGTNIRTRRLYSGRTSLQWVDRSGVFGPVEPLILPASISQPKYPASPCGAIDGYLKNTGWVPAGLFCWRQFSIFPSTAMDPHKLHPKA